MNWHLQNQRAVRAAGAAWGTPTEWGLRKIKKRPWGNTQAFPQPILSPPEPAFSSGAMPLLQWLSLWVIIGIEAKSQENRIFLGLCRSTELYTD